MFNDDSMRKMLNIVAHRGADRSGVIMTRWLNQVVHIEICNVHVLRIDQLVERVDESATVTVAAQVNGTLGGIAALLMTKDEAAALVKSMGGDGDVGMLHDEMSRSILQETANIVISAFLNNLSVQYAMGVLPEPPAYAIDLAGASWQALLMRSAEDEQTVLIETRLCCAKAGVALNLIFLPSASCINHIQSEMRHGPA